MAKSRMFSKRLMESARFLKMPASTQCLYFHLGLNADDDGIVEAYNVMKLVGATEDDLKVLVSKGFVIVLNEDLVTYITDWTENNNIRADRKIDSIYKDLLLQVVPDAKLQEKKQRADVKKKILEIGQPMDNQWTEKAPLRGAFFLLDTIETIHAPAPPICQRSFPSFSVPPIAGGACGGAAGGADATHEQPLE